jgi:RNA polymerase sigma factor (sigma-70 family)
MSPLPFSGLLPWRSPGTNDEVKSRPLPKINVSPAANALIRGENGYRFLPMDDSLDAWFKREILVYEAALLRYLTRLWPNPQEVTDLRQDIYVRVYEAAAKSRPFAPKPFLFTTARHLVADRIRRKRIVSIDTVGDLDALNVLIEEITPEQHTAAHQELRRLAEAIDELPPRCREVVWLRRVNELPQKDVAVRLGITQKRVEKHVMNGMKLLAAALFRTSPGPQRADQPQDTDETEHGQP